MPFFEFKQNNSGGSFDMNQDVAHVVIIEAATAHDANTIAEEKCLYFDGVVQGMDCSCCGDRWYMQWGDDKGDETPSIYGKPAAEYQCDWTPPGQPYCIIYHLNGTVERLLQPAEGGRFAKTK